VRARVLTRQFFKTVWFADVNMTLLHRGTQATRNGGVSCTSQPAMTENRCPVLETVAQRGCRPVRDVAVFALPLHHRHVAVGAVTDCMFSKRAKTHAIS